MLTKEEGGTVCGMPSNNTPFPPSGSPEPGTTHKSRSRMVFQIGSRRLAFDFYTQVTELRQEPTEVTSPPKSVLKEPGNQAVSCSHPEGRLLPFDRLRTRLQGASKPGIADPIRDALALCRAGRADEIDNPPDAIRPPSPVSQ
jgi:hypothetical protein